MKNYWEKHRALNIAVVEKKETQIILVTSAVGGVGKTTVAME